MTLLEDLQWRGLVADCTDLPALAQRLAQGPVTVYCGFDPTGDSLHVGHLMGQLTLRRFQLAGHHVLPLAGGATGMIGDPSGKSAERNLLTPEQLAHNVACIKGQLSRLLDFETTVNPARLVDNASWTIGVSYLDFLRDIGKHFSLNVMLAKDSVRSRMEGDHGISYTEFSYQLLQAFDFYRLRQSHGCELQIGGSDQWGNLTAGTDLIRKKLGVPAWGLTFPLITKSDGTKFGKTEGGAVWLDPQKTSPYRFYQFFINTEDSMVVEYLKKFTLLEKPAIEEVAESHVKRPELREAQTLLAREVTGIVHGLAAADTAFRASQILFGGGLDGVTEGVFEELTGEVHTVKATPNVLELLNGEGYPLVVALTILSLSPSLGQGRRDVQGGGIYVNNSKVTDVAFKLTTADLLFGKYLLLRKGKRTYAVLNCS